MNKFIAGLVLGAAAGAAVAMFLQTEKGKEILSDLQDAAGGAGETLKNKMKNFEEEMNELVKKGKAFINDLESKAKDTASSF